MPRNSSMSMSFPPFSGFVRKIIFASIAIFFALEIILWLLPRLGATILGYFQLLPIAVAHGQVWQLFTYSFLDLGVIDFAFAMLSIWFCGSILEGAYGTRFLRELYFTSVIAGALLASAISFTQILHLSPLSIASGPWAGVFGILIAIAVRMGDLEFTLFPLPITIRAKWLVTIYILVDIAFLLKDANAFGALLNLSGAFAGYLYLRFAPRSGFAFGFSERIYGIRNAWYKSKRRRAARKFEVYMGKQGRTVNFDKEGRYVDPDSTKDPNDKRWMN